MTSSERDSRSVDAEASHLPVLLVIDDACDQFERAWKAGKPLSIEAVIESHNPGLVADDDTQVLNLASELIQLEVTYRRQRGEIPASAEYSTRFPRLADTIHGMLSTIGGGHHDNGAPTYSSAPTTTAVPSAQSTAPELSIPTANSTGEILVQDAPVPGGPLSHVARIGEYRILEEIGRGGMGVVYHAWQEGLDRPVALKMIRAGELASEEEVRRFRIEATAAARLQHPSIVAIHAVGQDRGRHFFSMELIEGESASRRLLDGPFVPEEAARIVVAVARAVQYAHDHGIVHRDLKPANVLMGRDGNPRVTDFGVARFVSAESTLTGTTQALGTPGYASPEQLRGDGSTVAPAADIYSLGATLYAFLTGRAPFQAATPLETVRQVLDQEPVSPRLLNSAVPRDLETICLKCLSKSPADRYRTAADLADDLQRALDGAPIHARPAGRAERAWRWCRRRPALASLAAVSSVSLLAAILLGTAYFVQVEELNSSLRDINERLSAAVAQEKAAVAQAKNAQQEAQHNERAALEMAYVGDIQRAAEAWRSQDYRNLEEILDRQIPKPGRPDLRGFEWGYLHSHLTVPTQTLLSRDKPLYFACISPDERWIGVSGQESIVWLFDALSLALKHTIITEQREVNGLAFTPDSRIIASAGDDGRVRFWQVDTGAESRPPLRAHPEIAFQVAFRRGGSELIVCGNDPLIRRYQLDQNDAPLPPLDAEATVQGFQISPDGNLLVAVGNNGHTQVWDLLTGNFSNCTSSDTSHRGAIDAAWERGWFISGSNDHWLQTWKLTGGEPTSTVRGKLKFGSVALNPDRNWAVTGDDEGVMQFWAVSDGRLSSTSADFARPHNGSIFSVRWLPGGTSVLSVAKDGRCVVTPAFVAAHRVRHDFPELGELRALAPLGMSARYALCGEHESLRIWNQKTRQIEQTLDDRRWDQAVSSPEAGLLATRHQASGLIALWDSARAAKLSEFVYDKWVGDCALSPDGRSLAIVHSPTAGNEDRLDDRVSLVDPRTRQLRSTIEGFHAPQLLVFSPDSDYLAFKSEVDVLLFDAENGKKLGTFPHQTQALPAFHPDGALLATGGTDRRVILWDIEAEAPKAVLLGHQDRIAHLTFSHDGRTLATADETGEIRLWSVPTGKGLYVLDAASGREPKALLFTGSDDFLLDLGYGDFHLHAYESVHGH